MKRIICLLLAASIFALSGCSFTPTPGSTDKSEADTNTLADKGLELIGKVDKLAECEEYINLYTVEDEIAEMIQGVADNDYTNPEGIFIIENLDTIVLEKMLPEAKLPEDITKMVKDKFAATLPTQIAASNGATTLAAVSILSYSESFIYKNLQTPVTYLYTYGNGYNFMVTYIPSDEDIVNASVTAVINDGLSKCTSKEDVINFFKNALDIEGVLVSVVSEEVG